MRLIDAAAASGVMCAKFQMRDAETVWRKSTAKGGSADLGVEYTFDLLSRFELPVDDMFKALDYTKSVGLVPLCTPWDEVSFKHLNDYGIAAFKVASADMTNHELIGKLAEAQKPLICSTGMSSESEIKGTIRHLEYLNTDYALLHCNSTYPTPFKDVNLKYIEKLREFTNSPVGYSGHERGYSIPLAAVALGASIIEKHLTLDKSQEGTDHKVSLTPDELSQMVQMIADVQQSLGSKEVRHISQGEMINRHTLAKSIVASRRVEKGSIISRSDCVFKSPGQGLQPIYLEKLIGTKAKRDFDEGDFFYESDLKPETLGPRKYKFSRPVGVPCRYHDIDKMTRAELDFVEFHFSYSDLEIKPSDVLKKRFNIGYTVHCPELFKNDHLLDLASDQSEYRRKSIENLNWVCSITRELRDYFNQHEDPLIVVNAGGFSSVQKIPAEQKIQKI